MIPWSLREVSVRRWKQAQNHEAGFWKQPFALPPQQERVAQRYARLLADVSFAGTDAGCVLEVGSGPTCAIQSVNGCRRTFVDPLMNVYHPLCEDVPGHFVAAVGEKLPFPDAMFDAVFSLNVIDHVISPAAFLKEMVRVTRPGGFTVIGVYTHPRLFAVVRTFLERAIPWARETPHPFFFSRHSLVRLLRHYQMEVFRLVCVYAPKHRPSLHRQDWVTFARKPQRGR